MADTTNNIEIISGGDTASIATDYSNSGSGLTATHLPLNKVVWGEDGTGNRTSLTNPLPIQIGGQTGPVEITGWIKGATTATGGQDGFRIQNLNYGVGSASISYLAIAGNTLGSGNTGYWIGVTGYVQGLADGTPLAITGDSHIRGAMAIDAYGIGGTFDAPAYQNYVRGILIQGTSAGNTATVNGEVYPAGGFGVPIAVTGGRRLDSTVDSVTVSGTVSTTGGWKAAAATDSISVYGHDQGTKVWTRMFAGDGTTIGHSGDALNVNIMNAGMTFSVNIGATLDMGVTAAQGPLRIQGPTGSAYSNFDPITVRGEAAGAIDVISNSGVNATVTGTVTIDDTDIRQSLGGATASLITTLQDIRTGTNEISNIRSDFSTNKIKATISSISKPDNILAGSVSCQFTATALHSNMKVSSGITVKSSPNNTANVMIGNRTLTQNPNQGYLLEPGESIYIEISNLSAIYHMIDMGTPTNDTITLHYIGS